MMKRRRVIGEGCGPWFEVTQEVPASEAIALTPAQRCGLTVCCDGSCGSSSCVSQHERYRHAAELPPARLAPRATARPLELIVVGAAMLALAMLLGALVSVLMVAR